MAQEGDDKPEVPTGLGENPSASFDAFRTRLGHRRTPSETLRLPDDGSIGATHAPVDDINAPTEGSMLPTVLPERETFVLKRVLAHGGMGEVWEAEQASLSRTIAVKRIRAELSGSLETEAERREVIAVFHQEALTTARLEHPNIVPVYDYSMSPGGTPLLAMKLVRGRPWNEILAEDQFMPVSDFLAKHLQILVAMAQAVAFAHSRGIIHRDLKPSQVMVGEFGEVLLMDWGLALQWRDPAAIHGERGEFLNDAPGIDAASSPSGTPSFMAPEQTERSARRIGPWTDLYLLGATLYFVLTGSAVHRAESAKAAFLRAAGGIVEPPEERNPAREIPKELSALTTRLLASEPAARMANVREFIAAIQDYLSGAGRRRESQSIAAQAAIDAERLQKNYRAFGEILSRLDKARTLWPENPAVEPLRWNVLAQFSRAALASGDLTLATLQAESLPLGKERESLLDEIHTEESRRARDAAQRRGALVAVVALLGILALGGFLLREVAMRERASGERARQEKETADLLGGLNSLRDREAKLAADMQREIPVPDGLGKKAFAIKSITEERGAELVAARNELRSERARLSRFSILSGRMGQEPIELIVAEANLIASQADTRGKMVQAYIIYEQASRVAPSRPEPWTGMGLTSGRAGYYTSATTALERATSATLEMYGEWNPAYARSIERQAEFLVGVNPMDSTIRTFFARSGEILEPQLVAVLCNVASTRGYLGDIEGSLKLTSQALQLAIDRTGGDSIETIEAMDVYCNALRLSGDMPGYLRVQEEVDRLRVKNFPNDRELERRVLNDLGGAQRAAGDYEDATATYERALAIRDLPGGSSLSDDIDLKTQILNTWVDRGEWDEAARQAEELLKESEAVLGREHPITSRIMMTIAEADMRSNGFERAEKYLREIIAARSRDGALADVGTLQPMISLASVLSYQNRDAEAEEAYRQAIAMNSRLRGPKHLQTLSVMNNLAAHYGSRQRWRDSLGILSQVVEPLGLAMGREHPNVAIVYINLMPCLADVGDGVGSLAAGQIAVTIFRQRLGDRHPFVQRAVSRVNEAYGMMRERGMEVPPNMQFVSATSALNRERWPDTLRGKNAREDLLWPMLLAADALDQFDPPRTELATRYVRRSVAAFYACDISTTGTMYLHLLKPLAARHNVVLDPSTFVAPDGVRDPEGGAAVDALLPWLDTISPAPTAEELEGLPSSLDVISGNIEELYPMLMERLRGYVKDGVPPSRPFPPE